MATQTSVKSILSSQCRFSLAKRGHSLASWSSDLMPAEARSLTRGELNEALACTLVEEEAR